EHQPAPEPVDERAASTAGTAREARIDELRLAEASSSRRPGHAIPLVRRQAEPVAADDLVAEPALGQVPPGSFGPRALQQVAPIERRCQGQERAEPLLAGAARAVGGRRSLARELDPVAVGQPLHRLPEAHGLDVLDAGDDIGARPPAQARLDLAGGLAGEARRTTL